MTLDSVLSPASREFVPRAKAAAAQASATPQQQQSHAGYPFPFTAASPASSSARSSPSPSPSTTGSSAGGGALSCGAQARISALLARQTSRRAPHAPALAQMHAAAKRAWALAGVEDGNAWARAWQAQYGEEEEEAYDPEDPDDGVYGVYDPHLGKVVWPNRWAAHAQAEAPCTPPARPPALVADEGSPPRACASPAPPASPEQLALAAGEKGGMEAQAFALEFREDGEGWTYVGREGVA